MYNCIYRPLYQDRCSNETLPGEQFCAQHKDTICSHYSPFKDSDGKSFYLKCQKKAIFECNGWNGSWPCGYALCEDHRHNHH